MMQSPSPPPIISSENTDDPPDVVWGSEELEDTETQIDESLGSSPEEFLLGYLGHGALRLRKALVIRVAQADGQYIAEAPSINEFGFGDDPHEALRDLQLAIIELYFSLSREEAHLGGELSQTLTTLRDHILEVT